MTRSAIFDEVDKEASALAAAAVNGDRDEDEVRWLLCALVSKSGVSHEVAARRYRPGTQTHADLADNIEHLLHRKIIGDLPNGADLHRIADHASLSGWSRTLGYAATASEDVRRNRANARTPLLGPSRSDNDPDADTFDRVIHGEVSLSADPAVLVIEWGGDLDEVVDNAIEEFEARTRSRQQPAYPHERSRTICECFDLPRPEPVRDRNDRERLATMLERDPSLAIRTVEHLLHDRGSVDPLLANLFAGYSSDDLDRVLDMDPRVARALVEGAISPVPPAPARARNALRSELASCSDQRGWASTVKELVDAFSDASTDLRSDPADGGRLVHKTDAEMNAGMRRLRAALTRIVSFPGAPLGTDKNEVVSFIAQRLDQLITDTARQRTLTGTAA